MQLIDQILRYIAILTGNTVCRIICCFNFYDLIFHDFVSGTTHRNFDINDILLGMGNFVIKLHFFHDGVLLNSSELLSIEAKIKSNFWQSCVDFQNFHEEKSVKRTNYFIVFPLLPNARSLSRNYFLRGH